MTLKELVLATRSCRRFHQGRAVPSQDLQDLVDMVRMTASASNLQPLKYVLSTSPETNATIFPCLGWAAYLKDWPGPTEGERPAAYIVLLGDTAVSAKVDCDHGIAAQTILLGATEKGLAGCMLGSVNRTRLQEVLTLPQGLKILLVLALGVPTETPYTPAHGDPRGWGIPPLKIAMGHTLSGKKLIVPSPVSPRTPRAQGHPPRQFPHNFFAR